MSVEVRAVPQADLRSWVEAIETAFNAGVSDEYWQHTQRTTEIERAIGAYDGDRIVGGGGAFSFELTVPGSRTVAAAGVTSVGVLPSHRRRGILRSMMAYQLADVRRRGEPVAILWASEGSIYQRFGYGLATLSGTFDIARDRAIFRSDPTTATAMTTAATHRFVSLDEAAELFPPIYDAVCAATPGFLRRSSTWWSEFVLSDPQFARRGHDRKFYVVCERDGKPVAYVLYSVKAEWGDVGSVSQLTVQELIAIDADARREAWRFVFGVDLIGHIRNRFGSVDDPLLLMLAEPRRLDLRIRDGLWLRIVDVVAALEQRGYAADGSIVLDVRDDFIAEVGGRYRLTVSGGTASVARTDDPADIELDIGDLGAIYLGAFSFAQLARAGRTRALTDGAHSRADAILASPVMPWSPQIF